MLNKSFRYSALSVDLVELEPGESFTFQLNPASASYGVFALGGSRSSDDATEVTDPAVHEVTTLTSGAVPGRAFNFVGHWLPNGADHGWSNDAVGHEPMTITAGEQGARWVCLSRNESGEREVQHLRVDGESTLPAGWGFVVARGSFACDGKTAEQLAYFRPRERDLSITGIGDILLVR
ncbi:MAG: hypothetical protein RL268_2100 [Pseudomonadota bacterium]|jgi:hypothetical protein